MQESKELKVIARIRTDFPEKFGIPRQSGLVPSLEGRIIFEPEYRQPEAIKGIEEFSHLWLLWGFSKAKRNGFVATVTPPRLGGKEKKGVFATRSPFRPNSIGLSSVELKGIETDKELGNILFVAGADLLDGTPIYDIKPYLAYTDSHPKATGSYAELHKDDRIEVVFSEELRSKLPEEIRDTVLKVLEQDPRAAYNKKPDYEYGMAFADYDIRFKINEGILIVTEIIDKKKGWQRIK